MYDAIFLQGKGKPFSKEGKMGLPTATPTEIAVKFAIENNQRKLLAIAKAYLKIPKNANFRMKPPQ
jgi:hypothetical protein